MIRLIPAFALVGGCTLLTGDGTYDSMPCTYSDVHTNRRRRRDYQIIPQMQSKIFTNTMNDLTSEVFTKILTEKASSELLFEQKLGIQECLEFLKTACLAGCSIENSE